MKKTLLILISLFALFTNVVLAKSTHTVTIHYMYNGNEIKTEQKEFNEGQLISVYSEFTIDGTLYLLNADTIPVEPVSGPVDVYVEMYTETSPVPADPSIPSQPQTPDYNQEFNVKFIYMNNGQYLTEDYHLVKYGQGIATPAELYVGNDVYTMEQQSYNIYQDSEFYIEVVKVVKETTPTQPESTTVITPKMTESTVATMPKAQENKTVENQKATNKVETKVVNNEVEELKETSKVSELLNVKKDEVVVVKKETKQLENKVPVSTQVKEVVKEDTVNTYEVLTKKEEQSVELTVSQKILAHLQDNLKLGDLEIRHSIYNMLIKVLNLFNKKGEH